MEGEVYRAPGTYLTKQGRGQCEGQVPLTGLGEPLSYVIAQVLLREMHCEHHFGEGMQQLGEANLVRSLHSKVPQTGNGRLENLFVFSSMFLVPVIIQ